MRRSSQVNDGKLPPEGSTPSDCHRYGWQRCRLQPRHNSFTIMSVVDLRIFTKRGPEMRSSTEHHDAKKNHWKVFQRPTVSYRFCPAECCLLRIDLQLGRNSNPPDLVRGPRGVTFMVKPKDENPFLRPERRAKEGTNLWYLWLEVLHSGCSRVCELENATQFIYIYRLIDDVLVQHDGFLTETSIYR